MGDSLQVSRKRNIFTVSRGPEWEPQVIMHSSAPYSEEDIPTRWRDQQALVWREISLTDPL